MYGERQREESHKKKVDETLGSQEQALAEGSAAMGLGLGDVFAEMHLLCRGNKMLASGTSKWSHPCHF
jgi:hypothetical protein